MVVKIPGSFPSHVNLDCVCVCVCVNECYSMLQALSSFLSSCKNYIWAWIKRKWLKSYGCKSISWCIQILETLFVELSTGMNFEINIYNCNKWSWESWTL